jgi:hypothetical protein
VLYTSTKSALALAEAHAIVVVVRSPTIMKVTMIAAYAVANAIAGPLNDCLKPHVLG